MATGVQILILGLLGDQLSQHRLSQMGDAARIAEANEDNF